jgi:hypothetical protein
MKAALRGTQVRHYHGIDLSQAALDLAAANLAELPFEVDLDHRDFVEAMLRRPEHADATWCSFTPGASSARAVPRSLIIPFSSNTPWAGLPSLRLRSTANR